MALHWPRRGACPASIHGWPELPWCRSVPATKKSRPHSIDAITPCPPRSSTQSNSPGPSPIFRTTHRSLPRATTRPSHNVVIVLAQARDHRRHQRGHHRHGSRRIRRILRPQAADRPRVPQTAEEGVEAPGARRKGGGRGARQGAEEGHPRGRRERKRGGLPQGPRGGRGLLHAGGRPGRGHGAVGRRSRRGRPVLLPRAEGLPQPQRAHQHLRQDRAQARARHPRRDDRRRHQHPRGQQSAVRGRLRGRHRINAAILCDLRERITSPRADTAHCIILVNVKVPGQDLHQAGVLSGLAWMRGSKGGIDQDSQSNISLVSII